jgi:nucleotide-binding universal stress UspA family protein
VFHSIVVGTDGSATAEKAVDAAIQLAGLSGATLEMVCAYEPVPSRPPRQEALDEPAGEEWAVNRRAEVDATLRRGVTRAGAAGVTAREHAREGDAADAILDVAEELGADLIVVGNKGMTGAERFMLGSIPNKVSHHAPCAVMIIRTS